LSLVRAIQKGDEKFIQDARCTEFGILGNLGNIAWALGNSQQAIAFSQETLAMVRTLSELKDREPGLLSVIGAYYLSESDYQYLPQK
jgi:hypothetical protein